MSRFSIRVSAIALSLFGLVSYANAGDLEVQVTGISQIKGDVFVSLFNQKNQWLKKAVVGQKSTVDKGKLVLKFIDLPEGEYAISAYHDLNSNGALDTNPIGIPKEPYGFSNDAAGNFGPPSFDDAKIKVEGKLTTTTLRLN